MTYAPINRIGFKVEWNSAKAQVSNGRAKWVIFSNDPLQTFDFGALMISPGDSIHNRNIGDDLIYSGNGSVKFELIEGSRDISRRMPKPTKNVFTINSIQDYFSWNKHLDEELALKIPLIESYKKKIPLSEYDFIKGFIVHSVETARITLFENFADYCKKTPSSGISLTDLSKIWDTTQNKPWRRWLVSLSKYDGSMVGFYSYNREVVRRKFNFDFSNDSLRLQENRVFFIL